MNLIFPMLLQKAISNVTMFNLLTLQIQINYFSKLWKQKIQMGIINMRKFVVNQVKISVALGKSMNPIFPMLCHVANSLRKEYLAMMVKKGSEQPGKPFLLPR